ncbi:MAG: aminotransferase class V-fold PLP-dependent enzyme [Burkholderiaceae bacterium]
MKDDRKPRPGFPAAGLPREQVMAELEAARGGDADWRGGRVPLFVFKGSDAVSDIGQAAFDAYFHENALGGARAFPSVGGFERDVVAMALDLFGAPETGAGFMTSGGSESIVMAVKAARDWARQQGRSNRSAPANIVLPESGHPAFDKAAVLMDLEVRRVPVAADWRADVAAMDAAADGNTIMVVGSAPCFPFGVIDPIAALADMTRARDLWLHVDACVGGYLAPFARANGRPVPAFDFSVPGVTSLTADLHKYGFCPKPASTVLYADARRAACQPFAFDCWPSGPFTTATVVGTRPAGGVAGAWAVLRHLGAAGYREIARELMAGVDRYRAGVAAIPGLNVLGDPELAIVAVQSNVVDVFAVAARLQVRQWVPGLLRRPPALHRMMSMLHVQSMDDYLADLEAAVSEERADPGGFGRSRARYS